MTYRARAYRGLGLSGFAGAAQVRRSLSFGTALTGVAACALLAPPARASDECGVATNGVVTCVPAGNPYPNGISYATPVDLTVNLDSGVSVDSGATGGVSLSGSGTASVVLDAATGTSITTTGDNAPGVYAGGYDATVTIRGDVSTAGVNSPGVIAYGANTATVHNDGSVSTSGDYSYGIIAIARNGVTIDGSGSVHTIGDYSDGVFARSSGGDQNVAVVDLTTTGDYSDGINAVATGAGNVAVTSTGAISTSGYGARGVLAESAFGDATVSSTGSITTSGDNAGGVLAISSHAQGDATIDVGSVSTSGDHVRGLYGTQFGYAFGSATYAFGANATINVSGDLTTSGDFSRAAYARALYHAEVDVAGTTTTTGDYSNAITVVGYYGGATVHAGDIDTSGHSSDGIMKFNGRGPDDSVEVIAGDITTTGSASEGIAVYATQNVSVDVGNVSTSGDGSTGINVRNTSSSYGGYNTAMAVNADSVTTTSDFATGVDAQSSDSGTVAIDVGAISTQGYYSAGVHAFARYADVTIDTGSVTTNGDYAPGIYAVSLYGAVTVNSGTVSTAGDNSNGIYAVSLIGDVAVTSDGAISTEGDNSAGVVAASIYNVGDATVTVADVSTLGTNSTGVYAYGNNATVTVNGAVSTAGDYSPGVVAIATAGNAAVANNGAVSTNGAYGDGISATAVLDVSVTGTGTVSTTGDFSRGIDAVSAYGAISIGTGDVSTTGYGAQGVRATALGTGDTTSVTIDAASVTTVGDFSDAIVATSTDGDVSVASTGTVSTAGEYAYGVFARSVTGDIAITVNDLSTTGDDSVGVLAVGANASVTVNGDLATTGAIGSYYVAPGGVIVVGTGGTAQATIKGSVATSGDYAIGVLAEGLANTTVSNTGSITTTGAYAPAVVAISFTGDTTVENGGSIATSGAYSVGISANGNYDVTVTGSGSVSTTGDYSSGILALSSGDGAVSVSAGTIATLGNDSIGVSAHSLGHDGTADITVANVSTSGAGSDAVIGSAGGNVSLASTGTISTGGADTGAVILTSYYAGASATVHNVSASGAGSTAVAIDGGTTAAAVVTSGGTVRGAQDSVSLTSVDGSTVSNSGTILTGSGHAIRITGGPATIANAGTISGRILLTGGSDVVNNSGTFIALADSDFGAGTDTFNNSGTLTLGGGGAPRSVTLTGLEAFNNAGAVELRNGVAGDTLTLPGTFTGSGASALGLDINFGATTTTDLLKVGTAAGSTTILLDPLNRNALFTAGTTLVQAGAASSAGAFTLSPSSQDLGFVHYTLAYQPATFSYVLIGTPGAAAYRTAGYLQAAQQLWYKSADAVQAHLDGIRDSHWAAGPDAANGSALWLQMYGSTVTRDRTRSFTAGGATLSGVNLDYQQDSFGGQLGYDVGGGNADRGFVFGLTGGYQNSVLRYARIGDRISFDEVNGGIYASGHVGPLFVNALGKYDRYWGRAHDNLLGYSAKLDGNSYGGQAEAGVRLGSDKFFAEPVATIAYVHSTLDGFSAFGSTIDFDGMNGLRGKAGLRIGDAIDLNNGSKLALYASGEAVHEFKGRDEVTIANPGGAFGFRGDRIGTYGRGTLGINVASPGGVSGFIEGFGDYNGNYQGGGGRAGIRIRF